MPPRLILIGPMGSGKTTVGTLLAAHLGLSFRDTDQIIEAETSKTVSEIFLDEGEDKFRVLEKAVLRNELLADDTILALGGGAPLSIDARSALRAIATPVIYFDISLASVAPRIGFNRDRPLLLNNPRGQWETLMKERRPIYESIADVVIDVNSKTEGDVLQEILAVLA
jgi:shikimate kinase